MNRSPVFRGISIASVASLICLAVGCASSADPAPGGADGVASASSVQAARPTIVNRTGAALPSGTTSSIRITRAHPGDELVVEAPGHTEVAPGVWEGPEGRIVIGQDAHESEVAKLEAELSSLRGRASLREDVPAALATEIRDKEAQLGVMKATIALRPIDDCSTEPLACSYSTIVGPSSPMVGYPGAFGGGWVECSSGCTTFTIGGMACNEATCTSQVYSSNFVSADTGTWLTGVALQGTAGLGCAAAGQISPPGSTNIGYFNCN